MILTRYLLGSGTTRMNILLDRAHIPVGWHVTLRNDSELGPDAGKEWEVLERHETLEAAWVKRGWNNNI